MPEKPRGLIEPRGGLGPFRERPSLWGHLEYPNRDASQAGHGPAATPLGPRRDTRECTSTGLDPVNSNTRECTGAGLLVTGRRNDPASRSSLLRTFPFRC
jgi:hypothetical protein